MLIRPGWTGYCVDGSVFVEYVLVLCRNNSVISCRIISWCPSNCKCTIWIQSTLLMQTIYKPRNLIICCSGQCVLRSLEKVTLTTFMPNKPTIKSHLITRITTRWHKLPQNKSFDAFWFLCVSRKRSYCSPTAVASGWNTMMMFSTVYLLIVLALISTVLPVTIAGMVYN